MTPQDFITTVIGVSTDEAYSYTNERWLEWMEAYANHCQENTWISVDDFLPNFNERVLVEYRPDHPVMEGALIGIDERLDVTNSSLPIEIKRRITSRSDFKNLNVVRWRPLPTPPKQ